MTDAANAPRWIEYLDVEDLKPDPRNPKGHDLGELDASLDRFGYTEAIMLDERTGLLVSGHGRREGIIARRDRGGDPPDGVVVTDDGRWTVPVQRGWASSNDLEAGAYLIAANRLTEKGGWLGEPLASLLTELAGDDPLAGLAGTGYDGDDLGRLLTELRGPLEPTPPERFPTPDSDLPTEHQCPKCGYEWSGASS